MPKNHGSKLSKRSYEVLLAAQKGGCAICGTPPNLKKLSVDHCHTTLCIRGLLCSKCNTMLGYAEDDIEILSKAIEYLKNTTPPATLGKNKLFSRAYQHNRRTIHERVEIERI